MRPVLTVAEMRAVDAAAPEPEAVLVDRAGAAVARAALSLLGGGYGRRVVVVAGKGNNGADGRVAAVRPRRRGVRVEVLDAAAAPAVLPASDLVIDAAYGTGFRGAYDAPSPNGAPVLAVDIPSGIDGDTGAGDDGAVTALATVTFAAHKPGLLFGAGAERSGVVHVADIGLDVSRATIRLLEDGDARSAMPPRRRDDHKWKSAVMVVGGSPGLVGAPWLTARAALHTGAGNVRMGVPGATGWEAPPSEVYSRLLPPTGWANQAIEDGERCRAVVVGPGLGTGDDHRPEVIALLERTPQTVIADADALTHLGADCAEILRRRTAPTILTPHDGEFARLAGGPPGADRIGAARDLALRTGAVVLLKGPTTVVAGPDGTVLIAAAGSPALATAGSGDTLAGAIAAFVARGTEPLLAAAAGAYAHGAAAAAAPPGLVAGDLCALIPAWLDAVDEDLD